MANESNQSMSWRDPDPIFAGDTYYPGTSNPINPINTYTVAPKEKPQPVKVVEEYEDGVLVKKTLYYKDEN